MVLRSLRAWRSPRPFLAIVLVFVAPGVYTAAVVLFAHASDLGSPAWPTGDLIPIASPLLESLLTARVVAGTVNLLANVVFAFDEEYGWRGYLLPRLLPLGETRATLVVGVIWAGWHVPILIGGINYPGQNVWLACIVFSSITVGLSFPFTWFFRASGGSVMVTLNPAREPQLLMGRTGSRSSSRDQPAADRRGYAHPP